MAVENCPLNMSIREINDDCWIIGSRIILSRQSSPASHHSWSDGAGSFFVVSRAQFPLQFSRPLPATSCIQLVFDAGGTSAVWSIGDAFCKVKVLDGYATREHVTLKYLQDRRPLSFAIPEVHYHGDHDFRYYIILSKVTGSTLGEAWPHMDESIKHHYVCQVASICKELAMWQGDKISGVDGRRLSDYFLTRRGMLYDNSAQNLSKNSEELGMDCSTLCFYHCDLGPGNIIVNLEDRSIGLIDWEAAGFVPKEWIRTKFCISSGLNLPSGDHDSRADWRSRCQKQLEEEGFPEVTDQWVTWWNKYR